MKSIKKIIFVLVCCGSFCACEDYLAVTPESAYTDESFYLTATDFETAISGCYSDLNEIFGKNGTGYINTLIARSDECRNSSEIGRFMESSNSTWWSNPWKNLWSMVSRCNKILDKIDGVDFSDQTQKANIKGEALALRGYAYFQFAWCWGGVPLITKPLSLSETHKIARSSQEATYAQAESDFKQAYELLPEAWPSTKTGRVTRYAAAGMLGRLYLYQCISQRRAQKTGETPTPAMAEKAAEWLKLVIDKEGSLYKMATVYTDCFDGAKNNSAERVWETQYLSGASAQALGLSTYFPSIFIPSSLNLRRGDGTKMGGVTFTGGSGSFRASLSIADSSKYELISGNLDDPLSVVVFDKRRDATLVNGLYVDKSTPVYDYYFVKKFLIDSANFPSAIDYWGTNLPILRYTDVKMMYAEALNEVDYAANKTTIFSILNEVRTRGGLKPISEVELPDYNTVFDCIVHERFVEFAFEGLRWPDLVRWRLAEEKIAEHFALQDEGYDESTETPMYGMKKYHHLAPIPYIDIVAYNNENILWQNEGY
ncbi:MULTISPECIES: RagB/SusD family nutrient uptake outer membrane protein [Bacteroidales]|jgi:ragB/susD domain protein|uniref:RagB/SusD family nutrient uptake outer membrane protein n=1 Tax=Bacteroidales TaxID=171549 RepID=UPI0006935327|nr:MULTISPECIES: RagB/SusD family nutrient uptake outer membrane protein [Bacteroidales]